MIETDTQNFMVLIMDTNDKEPEVVFDIVIKELKDFGFRTN